MRNEHDLILLQRIETAYRKNPSPELAALVRKAYQTEFFTLQEIELIELTERSLYSGSTSYGIYRQAA